MHAIAHLATLTPLAVAAALQAEPATAEAASGVLGQQIVTGLSNGMIIALIAIGYTMVYGIIELINFAHGDLCTLGAFFALMLVGALGMEAWSGVAGMGGVVLLLAGAAAFCALFNWSIDRVVYRPLRSAPKLTLLVSAIGCSFVLVNLALFWGGLPMEVFGGGVAAAAPKDFPAMVPDSSLLPDAWDSWVSAEAFLRSSPSWNDPSIWWLTWAPRVALAVLVKSRELNFTTSDLLVWCVTLPLMVALTGLVRCTRLGKAMRAVAQNPTAASLMGIDVDRVIGAAFLIGGALGGFASVIYALYNNTISFQMGYRTGMDAFTAAVLGGIGSMPGAVVGGLLIGVARAISDGYIEARWTNSVVFAILIATLVFRPSGLLGAKLRDKV